MSKYLYLIRHGKALHNELFDKIGVKAFRIKDTIDSSLTKQGHEQSIHLGQTWEIKDEIELVLVSPLTRALETAVNIFGNNTPIVCQEFLREYPKGSMIILEEEYGDVVFLVKKVHLSGLRLLVPGFRCLVSGFWCLVSGVWCLVTGV